jgi:hypothetical protein
MLRLTDSELDIVMAAARPLAAARTISISLSVNLSGATSSPRAIGCRPDSKCRGGVEQLAPAHLARARGLLSLYRCFFETKPWSRASSFSAADRVSSASGRY